MNNAQLEKRNAAKPSLDERWSHYYGTGSENTRIHYVRQGQGTPVLLLHGWPGFWFDWRKVIPQLSVSADVIAPDFRGFGDSGKPDLPAAEGYNPQVLAKDILALLDFYPVVPRKYDQCSRSKKFKGRDIAMSFIVFMILFAAGCGWLDVKARSNKQKGAK